MVDHGVETDDTAFSKDCSAHKNTPVCDNSETVRSGVTTSLQEDGLVDNLSDLTANEETKSKLPLDGPVDEYPRKQEPDTTQSSDRLTAVVNDNCLPDAVTEVMLDTAECSDQSTVTVNGNRLLDGITEDVSCRSKQTVESCGVNLDSKLPVTDTVMAENCALVSVAAPVSMLSASSLPSAASYMPECALDNDIVKQFGCETDVDNATAEHAQDELISAQSSPQCLDMSYSELTSDNVSKAAVTEPVQSAVLHCDIDDGAGMKTTGSNYLVANCSVDAKAQVAVAEESLQAVIKSLETSNDDILQDNCSAGLETEAAETEQSIHHDEAEIKTSETRSHDHRPDYCSENPKAEVVVPEQSFHSDVSHCDMDDDAGIKTPKASISDHASANCSMDRVVLGIVNSAEKSDVDHGWSGNPRKNELAFCANKKQSVTFDRISAVLVLTGDQSAECYEVANNSNSNCSNFAADYDELNVTATAAKNAADISQPVNVSVAANSKVQSSTPAVTIDKHACHGIITGPINVELQQKIIRQMEVCVMTVLKCKFKKCL